METPISTVSPDTSFSPTSTLYISTRFTKQRESIDNLPTSERTRNRQKTVIRRSYKDLLTKGIAKPTKSYVIKSRKDLVSPQTETRHALSSCHKIPKVVSPEMRKFYEQGYRIRLSGRFKGSRVIFGVGLPKYLNIVTRKSYVPIGSPSSSFEQIDNESLEQYYLKPFKKRKERDKKFTVVSSIAKRGSKNIAKSLLDKAKKGKEDPAAKKHKKTVKKKQFVLPTQSSRSSRVIIPTKRFIEDEISPITKKKKENLFDTSLTSSFKQPFTSPSSQKKMDKLTIQTDFPSTAGFGSFSPSKNIYIWIFVKLYMFNI